MAAQARRQDGVIARDQIYEAGLSSTAVRYRLKYERLREIHPGVFAVGAMPLTRRGRWFAALLATRPGPVLSHGSAAALHGIEREGPHVDITVPRRSGHRIDGIVLHRVRRLVASDRTRVNRLPVTTVSRTLLDLAGTLSEDRFRKAFEHADRLELLDVRALRETAARNPGRRGLGRFTSLLDDYLPTDGALEGIERHFQMLLEEEKLPHPERNVLVHGFLVDCYWPEAGLVVELDSRGWHSTWEARERDVVRDSTLLRHGIPTIRITHRRITRERAGLVGDLRAQLDPVYAKRAG